MLDILLGRKRFYCVHVHGEGIRVSDVTSLLPGSSSTEPIVGFYALRTFLTADPQEATSNALSMLDNEWQQPWYSLLNQGQFPSFTVEEVNELSFWDGLRRKNAGYIFYGADKK